MQNRVHTVHCKHFDIFSISSGSCSCLAASWTLKHPALYKQTIQNKSLAILNILHFPINNESHKRNTNELEWTTLESYYLCLNFMNWALHIWIKASSIWMIHHIVEEDTGFSFNGFPLHLPRYWSWVWSKLFLSTWTWAFFLVNNRRHRLHRELHYQWPSYTALEDNGDLPKWIYFIRCLRERLGITLQSQKITAYIFASS